MGMMGFMPRVPAGPVFATCCEPLELSLPGLPCSHQGIPTPGAVKELGQGGDAKCE